MASTGSHRMIHPTLAASLTCRRETPTPAQKRRLLRRRRQLPKTLITCLAYLVVFDAILTILDRYRRPAPELLASREGQAAVAAVSAGLAI